jgi:hypothetical protein
MYEIKEIDELRPGIELIQFRGGAGYEDEVVTLSNSIANGLRFEVENDDLSGVACFHIKSPETARLIAGRLVEWSKRIANPPDIIPVYATKPAE